MPTIVRGHSFGIHDIVTAQTLNDLVRLAQISGLSIGDVTGTTVQISVFSAPSGAANGWVSAQYEPTFVSANASHSQFNYVIKTAAGPVALFKPLGLETNRFHNAENTFPPGSALLIKVTGAANVTLQVTGGYSVGSAQHSFLGANYGTSVSSATNFPRVVLKGAHDSRAVDAGGPAVYHYFYLINAVTAQWQHSPGVTDTDKVAAISMDHGLSGDTTIPGWLFGAPLWRA